MDAKHWTGAPGECLSDEPWFSVDDTQDCGECGAAADEVCAKDCTCIDCERRRASEPD